jgi:hypothetical protein
VAWLGRAGDLTHGASRATSLAQRRLPATIQRLRRRGSSRHRISERKGEKVQSSGGCKAGGGRRKERVARRGCEAGCLRPPPVAAAPRRRRRGRRGYEGRGSSEAVWWLLAGGARRIHDFTWWLLGLAVRFSWAVLGLARIDNRSVGYANERNTWCSAISTAMGPWRLGATIQALVAESSHQVTSLSLSDLT